MEHNFGFDLPKAMHPEFGHIVQVETDLVGKEISPRAHQRAVPPGVHRGQGALQDAQARLRGDGGRRGPLPRGLPGHPPAHRHHLRRGRRGQRPHRRLLPGHPGGADGPLTPSWTTSPTPSPTAPTPRAWPISSFRTSGTARSTGAWACPTTSTWPPSALSSPPSTAPSGSKLIPASGKHLPPGGLIFDCSDFLDDSWKSGIINIDTEPPHRKGAAP